MSEFIPWNSQPLDDRAAKYAKDKAIPVKMGEEMHRILKGSRLEVF